MDDSGFSPPKFDICESSAACCRKTDASCMDAESE
eukprot:CAMPEP_0184289398 /NCGR_PEP_ID=MMETSP1049-20130417/1864_1 /TAXON_ID=77928 /ORGANISM="Proteomonas sulcata, Strain CCMP704" /LENGTH=34 /DNA_ID= /DNA_START= /DNA_END= /DNA_ORIENTATION=